MTYFKPFFKLETCEFLPLESPSLVKITISSLKKIGDFSEEWIAFFRYLYSWKWLHFWLIPTIQHDFITSFILLKCCFIYKKIFCMTRANKAPSYECIVLHFENSLAWHKINFCFLTVKKFCKLNLLYCK